MVPPRSPDAGAGRRKHVPCTPMIMGIWLIGAGHIPMITNWPGAWGPVSVW